MMTENETIQTLMVDEKLDRTMNETRKTNKKGAGPPIKYTDEKVSQFIALLQRGARVEEALDTIKISMATHGRKLQSDRDYAMRVAGARQFLKLASRLVVHDAIQEKKDVNTARWYLDREVYDKERNQSSNLNFLTQINNFVVSDSKKFQIESEDNE